MEPYGYDFSQYRPHLDNEMGFFWKALLYLKTVLAPSTWISFYSVWHTEIEVNDEISILGILRIDPETGVYFMDKPFAVLKNEVSSSLSDLQWRLIGDHAWSGLKFVFYMGVICYGAMLITSLRAMIQENERALKLEQTKRLFRETDYNNKDAVENGPPFVRAPAQTLSKVVIDSYKCTRCGERARDIINLECMHCYMCFDCFKQKEDKFKCNVCGKRVEKVVRIYINSSK